MPEKRREKKKNLRMFIVPSKLACSFGSQPFDATFKTYTSAVKELKFPASQFRSFSTFAMVTASVEKSDCQQDTFKMVLQSQN